MVAFFDADMLALDEPDSVFNFPLPNETFVGALGSGVPSKSRPRWRNPDPQRRAGGGVSFSVIEWKLKRHEGAVALRSESRRGAFVVGLAAAMQQLGDHLVRHPPPGLYGILRSPWIVVGVDPPPAFPFLLVHQFQVPFPYSPGHPTSNHRSSHSDLSTGNKKYFQTGMMTILPHRDMFDALVRHFHAGVRTGRYRGVGQELAPTSIFQLQNLFFLVFFPACFASNMWPRRKPCWRGQKHPSSPRLSQCFF